MATFNGHHRLPIFLNFLLLFLLNPAKCGINNDPSIGTHGLDNDADVGKEECPSGCICTTESPTTLDCSNLDLEAIPQTWPSHFERLIIRNWTMSTVEKQAFRRFQQLRELHILDCAQLDLIDRHAFKQLRKLRTLTIRGNKNLRELYKASFSGIGNEHALSIKIADNALERVRAFTFKNAQNLRELTIEERCFELEAGTLAGISRLDFLTLKGICALEAGTFQNTSRLHQLHITDCSLSQLPRNGFAELSHVNQLQIRECRIGRVEGGALAGLFTVGSVQLQSNQIGRLSPDWANGTENVGSLVFSYNTIKEALISPDCLRHGAQRFLFTENTLHCSCALQWLVNAPQEEQWLAENYCGREEAFKALLYFSPSAAGCPQWTSPPMSASAPSGVPKWSLHADGDAPSQPPPMHARSWGENGGESPTPPSSQPAWIDPEDEPFDSPAHKRRHSSTRNGAGSGGIQSNGFHRALFLALLVPLIPIL